MSRPMMPELRAIQKLINTLEPFTAAEQYRIVQVATHMMGQNWASGVLQGDVKARRLLAAAQSTPIKKVG